MNTCAHRLIWIVCLFKICQGAAIDVGRSEAGVHRFIPDLQDGGVDIRAESGNHGVGV